MKVCPQNAATDLVCGLEQMMMIVPVDAQVDKTEYIAQKHWQQWLQSGKLDRVRHVQFQHHDCDDDGKNSVAERFESTRFHLCAAHGLSSLIHRPAVLSSLFVNPWPA